MNDERRRPDPWASNPYAPPREKLIERQIREAQAEGAFDGLPFHGERIPLEDDTAAGEWALAHRMLKGAGFAPPWIETDREIRELLARRDALFARAGDASEIQRPRDRAELTRLVGAINDAIFRLNHEAPTDRQQRRALDLDGELAKLDRAHSTGS